MRDPGIHITRKDFKEILDYLAITNFPIDNFFMVARKKSISSRAVLIQHKKDTKKIQNTLLASIGDAQLIADLIYAIRMKLNHRGIRKITQSNTREWALCKKLADICNTFCSDFELDTREGFIEYLSIGFKRIGKGYRNWLQRLVSMADAITEEEAAVTEIKDLHQFKDEAKRLHDYFIKRIASETGIYQTYEENPLEYVWFYRLAEFLDERHWDSITYIDAQFDALSYCNGIPSLQNLMSDKSIEHFNKSLYKNRNTYNKPKEIEGSIWDQIK